MNSVHSFHPSPNTYHTHSKTSITFSIHPTSQTTQSHIEGLHILSHGTLGGSKNFHKTLAAESTTLKNVGVRCQTPDDIKNSKKSTKCYSLSTIRTCSCIRRHFMEAVGTDLLPIHPPHASKSPPNDPMVAEALPFDDASIDAVIGTLVLCSVKDVDLTLQEIRRVLKPGGIYLFVEHVAAEDGTILKFVQSILDPLQQTVSDGCHLTRKTGNSIAKAGFSAVDIHKVFISTASLVNPHVYGIAHN